MPDFPDTKDKLIKVAIDLFAAKGFRGTSIRDIADAMDMSISNIYHYFGNKEGLFFAILEQASKGVMDELQKISKIEMDPLDRFKLLIKTHLRLSESYRKESKIFFIDEEHLSPEGRRINRQIQRNILNIYRKELRTLKELGYLGNRNITVLAFNILGVINWHLRWYRPGGALSLEEVSQEIVTFVMHGLLGPGAPQVHQKEP
jgi:AcrR family transcriptional regulator